MVGPEGLVEKLVCDGQDLENGVLAHVLQQEARLEQRESDQRQQLLQHPVGSARGTET